MYKLVILSVSEGSLTAGIYFVHAEIVRLSAQNTVCEINTIFKKEVNAVRINVMRITASVYRFYRRVGDPYGFANLIYSVEKYLSLRLRQSRSHLPPGGRNGQGEALSLRFVK